MNTMPVSELIERVAEICKKNGVKRLDLFGTLIFIGGYRKIWKANILIAIAHFVRA